MGKNIQYQRWSPDFTSRDFNPQSAKEVIIRCFFEAQKETFARSKQKFGTEVNDEKIMSSVKAMVRLAFKSINGDFNNPTKSQLKQVIGVLARKAKFMGTPPDIIDYHEEQINNLLTNI